MTAFIFAGNEKVADIALRNRETIAAKVLAETMTAGENFAVSKEWNVNGENVTISVERVANK